MGTTHLYQKPYPAEFDFTPFSAGWRIPEFTKFNGDNSRTTWEHVSQYVLQLGEAGFNDALRVRSFSLSLTGWLSLGFPRLLLILFVIGLSWSISFMITSLVGKPKQNCWT